VRRKLVNLAALLSLLLCAAILSLLLVGSRIKIIRDTGFTLNIKDWTLAIEQQWISISNTATPMDAVPVFGGGPGLQARGVVHMRLPGFRFTRFTWPPQCPLGTWWSCSVASVVPLLLSGMLPTMWLVRRRARSAQNPTCKRCGYNLTGNTNGVCPECGAAVAEKV
jgi:hypothetical protein